jgi:nucleoside-diphosphate-sugar epimerase
MSTEKDTTAPSKAFVTGGTGLLGSYLLRALVARGVPTRALFRNQKPELLTDSEKAAIEWVKGDLLDAVQLREEMSQVTDVYHCAGMVSFNPARFEAMRTTNVEGTANVVNAALESGIRKLVHVSSVSALGRKRDHATITESVKWDDEANLSAYGKTKYQAEMEVWRGISEGLNAVIVNPTIILGTGDWNKGSAAMFKNAWKEFPWYTDGSSGFVDAADVAEAMIRLMGSDISEERFIVSAENRTYREIFAAMAKGFGKKEAHRKASPWMGSLVWRLEKIKSLFSDTDPLLTRETAETAQIHVFYQADKLQQALPGFRYRSLDESIAQYCREYLVKMKLPSQ